MSVNELAPVSPMEIVPVPNDLHYVEEVVRIAFPVQSAKTYLRRHLGNTLRVRLVEAMRGESLGQVRAAEIIPSAGGEPMLVRRVRERGDYVGNEPVGPEEAGFRTELCIARGAAIFTITPRDSIILHVPVRGYLRYLPGIYQGTTATTRRDVLRADEVSLKRWGVKDQIRTSEIQPTQTANLRRFLFIFQHLMSSIIEQVDHLPSLTNPLTADPRFLQWNASWVNFEFDASLPVHQQRELVRRAIRLYRNRGTRRGVEEMVRVLTNVPVKIVERRKPAPVSLGRICLAGGTTPVERLMKGETGVGYLMIPDRPDTLYFVLLLEKREAFIKRFGERSPEVLKRICRIVTAEKPAHVTFTVRFEPLD